MSNRKNNSKAISSTSNDAILEMIEKLEFLLHPEGEWFFNRPSKVALKWARRGAFEVYSEYFEDWALLPEKKFVFKPSERKPLTAAQRKKALGSANIKQQLATLGAIYAFNFGLRTAAKGSRLTSTKFMTFPKTETIVSLTGAAELIECAFEVGYEGWADVEQRVIAAAKKHRSEKAEKAKAEKAKAEKVATKKVATKKTEPEAPPASGISYDILSAMIKEAVAEAVAEATKKAEPKAKAKKTASKKQTRQQLELAALEMAATQKTTRLRKKA